ncbi:MAG: TldD/PmbA family protein [Thermoplasmata archaeon]|nr:MAG: TldD/PmbA family protein [Thermoplasmata archaeon]
MEELMREGLKKAQELNASYADIRWIDTKIESIQLKNGQVEGLQSITDSGFGIRVIANGSWGFASSCHFDRDEVLRTADMAVRIAKSSARVQKHEIVMAPQGKPVEKKYENKYKHDPFEVPLEDKLALLSDASKLMERSDVKLSAAFMSAFSQHKRLMTTEGTDIEQTLVGCGAGIEATAVSSGESHKRSYPCSFHGNYGTRGYEFIKKLNLTDHAERVGKEAVALLDADPCPKKTTNLILDSSQVALQVHESCGHPTELDRVLGYESSFAGESFLTLDKRNNFKYGSEFVNINADATIAGGLGSFAFDDEGTRAQKIRLVSEGNFVGYMMSRETASTLNLTSNGTMRATNWNRIPLIRMTNVNLQPGSWNFDELIEDTKSGVYMLTNRSWSIDDKRLNFQFGTEVAYEVEAGELGRMLKNPVYSGMTPQFWADCDAICGKDDWQLWGVPNCGKGEPMQIIGVGHGAAPARFKKVKVGVGK